MKSGVRRSRRSTCIQTTGNFEKTDPQIKLNSKSETHDCLVFKLIKILKGYDCLTEEKQCQVTLLRSQVQQRISYPQDNLLKSDIKINPNAKETTHSVQSYKSWTDWVVSFAFGLMYNTS